MSKKIVVVATAKGVCNMLEKWLSDNTTCELIVSRNVRRECCVEIVYDGLRPAELRMLLQAAKGEIIELQ